MIRPVRSGYKDVIPIEPFKMANLIQKSGSLLMLKMPVDEFTRIGNIGIPVVIDQVGLAMGFLQKSVQRIVL